MIMIRSKAIRIYIVTLVTLSLLYIGAGHITVFIASKICDLDMRYSLLKGSPLSELILSDMTAIYRKVGIGVTARTASVQPYGPLPSSERPPSI
jgi:hypothetical protein